MGGFCSAFAGRQETSGARPKVKIRHTGRSPPRGRGTYSAVSLPLRSFVPLNASPPLPPVIIVDDSANDRFLLQTRLEEAGVKNTVLTFDSGNAVLAYLAQTYLQKAPVSVLRPCAIFLDVGMPGMSGFDVLTWLRRHEVFRKIAVIVVSDSPFPDQAERAHELGADQYLLKYPVPEVLARILGDAAAMARLR